VVEGYLHASAVGLLRDGKVAFLVAGLLGVERLHVDGREVPPAADAGFLESGHHVVAHGTLGLRRSLVSPHPVTYTNQLMKSTSGLCVGD